ncbi:hypothetical protein HG531_004554 [Fusarium graminearum]|nr:hypothetical protein HG531_004554 [Fusarium graminearum]
MCVGSRKLRKLGDVHVQARTAKVVTLEVSDVEELGRLLGVANDVGSAVTNATRGVDLAGTRRGTLGSSVGAEVGSDTAETIARAAGVERAGVHASEIPASLGTSGLLGTRLLRTANSTSNSHRHRVLSLAETDGLTELETSAAVEAPSVLVDIFDELLCDAEVLTQRVATITRLDLVDEASSILGGLGGLVREGTSTAANPLLGGKGGTEVLLVVVLVEVGGRDLALLG